MRLLHRTCDHGKHRIEPEMVLRAPNVAFHGLIWLSDLENPSPQMLGLTSFMLRCNRMEWVCEVETTLAVPWTDWAHENRVPLHIRLALDGAPGAQPRRWWVSEHPLEVLSITRGRENGVLAPW